MTKPTKIPIDLAAQSMNTAPFPICWINQTGTLIGLNNHFCKLIGYNEDELLLKKVMDIHPDFSLKTFQSYFDELNDKSESFESTILLKSGIEKQILITPKIFNTHEAKILCHYVNDIETQKNIEKELLANQERWKVGMEILNEGVWDWSISNNKIFFSNQFAENLGYTRKELSSFLSNWNDFLHPDDAPKYSIRLADHLKGLSKKYESEHRLKTKSGKYRWFKDRGMVIDRDENGRATRMIGSSLDITDKLEYENKEKETTKRH